MGASQVLHLRFPRFREIRNFFKPTDLEIIELSFKKQKQNSSLMLALSLLSIVPCFQSCKKQAPSCEACTKRYRTQCKDWMAHHRKKEQLCTWRSFSIGWAHSAHNRQNCPLVRCISCRPWLRESSECLLVFMTVCKSLLLEYEVNQENKGRNIRGWHF